MFEKYKEWKAEQTKERVLTQAYHPLFDAYDECSHQINRLLHTIDYFRDFRKQLLDDTGKPEAKKIKDKWIALQIDTIMERYQVAVDKLKEALDNLPKRPEDPDKYIVSYNNGSDDF